MRESEGKREPREIVVVACTCMMALAGIFELAVVSPDSSTPRPSAVFRFELVKKQGGDLGQSLALKNTDFAEPHQRRGSHSS
jgi:hypothetical protein